MANGQPRPAFYVAVFLVVVGLVGLALWRYGAVGPGRDAGQISNEELAKAKGGVEAPDSSGITTVKEYKYVAGVEAARRQGHLQLQTDGGSDRPLRDQRVGGLEPDDLRK